MAQDEKKYAALNDDDLDAVAGGVSFTTGSDRASGGLTKKMNDNKSFTDDPSKKIMTKKVNESKKIQSKKMNDSKVVTLEKAIQTDVKAKLDN